VDNAGALVATIVDNDVDGLNNRPLFSADSSEKE
jgi:hypothetical protein